MSNYPTWICTRFSPGILATTGLGLVLGLRAFAAPAEEATFSVRPEDTGVALVNPDMGWTMHFYSNIPQNYGSKLEPSDTLEDFPGISTVYLRVPWAFLQPEEGRFNWALLDTPAQRWIAKGKRVAFRITCSENWIPYATPEWVRKAGAKGYFYEFGKGRTEQGTTWDPDFGDPVFLDKLERFLAAMAARYDGNPNVAFIDIGSYGMWGEGHTHMSSQVPESETFAILKQHIDLHVKHFQRTLLCI
ncbi:MAG TPA: beta-galactosidase, partial [Clostridia bacterium]|nr:beta-galactosidase [Clostridia bacterium]